MTVLDTTVIRFRLLRSYRVGDGAVNLDRALQAACQDVAALCARVDELQRLYEPDIDRRPLNAVGVPQESIRDAQRLRELD